MPARILVVDDDASILRLVRLNLEMEGYDVLEASDGKQALDALAKSKKLPDLMVCDVMMPGMDGLEVVRRIRKDDQLAALPVLLLSAKAQDRDVQHGKSAGADDYLTKPFDPDDLLETVARLLKAGPRK
ncbi:MAG TPA: response regulator [Actinomycetota bacterium]|nr:response regulator [Actinomycetota bacterium]